MDVRIFLTLAAILFSTGVYGILSRRNAIGVLLSVELMANAVNINLVAFALYSTAEVGQVFTLFAIALKRRFAVLLDIGLPSSESDSLSECASQPCWLATR